VCAQHALSADAAPLRFAARLKRVPLDGVARRMAGAEPMMAEAPERGGLPLARWWKWRRGGS